MSTKLKFTDFQNFANFDKEILREIIREGELDLQARLATANSADQRALSLFGFQLTISIALVGAIYALSNNASPDRILVLVGIFQLLAMAVAAFKSMQSIRPQLLHSPAIILQIGLLLIGMYLPITRLPRNWRWRW